MPTSSSRRTSRTGPRARWRTPAPTGVNAANRAKDECLASLDRELPDVVLTDLAMPGADGFELIRRLRDRPAERGGRVPAIALTAYARSEDSERSLAAGFDVHLSKPVDLDDLLSTVASFAGGRREG